jgi:hypothetical protein
VGLEEHECGEEAVGFHFRFPVVVPMARIFF